MSPKCPVVLVATGQNHFYCNLFFNVILYKSQKYTCNRIFCKSQKTDCKGNLSFGCIG